MSKTVNKVLCFLICIALLAAFLPVFAAPANAQAELEAAAEPAFTIQPNNVSMELTDDFGVLFWQVNFVPKDNNTFWITGGVFGEQMFNVSALFTQENGYQIDNTRDMLIAVPRRFYSRSDQPPYRIYVKDGSEVLCVSDPFFVVLSNRLCFFKQPQDVIVPTGGTAEVSWEINIEIPDTEKVSSRKSGGYYSVYSPGLMNAQSLWSIMEDMGDCGWDDSILLDSNMTITVNENWVSSYPYRIRHYYKPSYTADDSMPFYIRQGYAVTFVGNEYPRSIPVQAVLPGTCASKPPIPSSIAGYTFGGWYTDSRFTKPYDFSTPIMNDLTLYARWQRKAYTVSFDTGSEASAPAPQKVLYGDKAASPKGVTSDHHDLEGWYLDPEYTHAYDFDTPVTKDMTLYAKWTISKYLVSFNSLGIGTQPSVQEVEYGKTAERPDDPSQTGYIFDGWYKSGGGYTDDNKYDFSKPVTGHTALKAKWIKICNISFDPGGGSGTMASDSRLSGESYTAPECTFKAPSGKHFVYWDVSTQNTGVFPGKSITVSNDTVFTPRWESTAYRTVTFDMNGHGSQIDEQRIELNGTAARPDDPTADGFTFTGWYISRDAANIGLAADDYYRYDFTKTVTENVTVYAGWRDDTVYKIDLCYGGAGFGSYTLTNNNVPYPEGTAEFYAHPGDVIEIKNIVPAEGCTFDNYDNYAVTVDNAPNRNMAIGGTKRFTMQAAEASVTVYFGLNTDTAAEGYHVHDSTTEYIHVTARQGDCMHDGWREHYECPVCGKWFSYDNLWDRYDGISDISLYFQKAAGHKPGEPEVKTDIPPTCEDGGRYEAFVYCSVCGEQIDHIASDLPATGHDWSETQYSYSKNLDKLTATRFCKNDPSHVETETTSNYETIAHWEADCEQDETFWTEWTFENPAFGSYTDMFYGEEALGHAWNKGTVKSKPTCENDGSILYKCTRTGCGKTKTVPIPTLGHDWGDPEYTWSSDNKKVTASAVCGNDSSHTVKKTVNAVYSVNTPATCTIGGVGVFTASFADEPFETQMLTVPIEASGHRWGTPQYVWSSDNSKVTAKSVCLSDSSHVTEETVETVYEVTTPPTASAPGEGTYTAEFSWYPFDTQTKTVEIPKLTSYKVTFDADGGTPAPAAQSVASGGKAAAPTAPKKTGYNFAGWYNGTEKYDFSTPVTAALKLKAKWTPKEYKVTFDANGGSGTMSAQNVNYGESFTLPSNGFTAPAGKQFDKWDIGGSKYAAGDSITVKTAVSAKATWKDLPPSSYTVTVNAGTGGTARASAASAAKGTTVTVTATPSAGYAVSKITYTPTGGSATDITSAKKFTMPDRNVTVKVTFKSTAASVSASVSGNKLTYTVKNPPAGAKLFAARYDSGRMTDVRITDNVGTSGSITMGGSGTEYKIILMDGETNVPLCKAWSN